MNYDRHIIGETIRRLRQQRNLTQLELASRSMIRLGYIGKIEIGECNSSLRALFRIAQGVEMLPSEVLQEVALPAGIH